MPDGIGVLVLVCVQLARVARISLDRTGWTWKGWRVGVTRGAVGAAGAEGFDPEESVPPRIPVRLDEVVGLLAAYRLARAEVERIRRGLAGRDGGQERATVTATVDADGEPMVRIELPGVRTSPGD